MPYGRHRQQRTHRVAGRAMRPPMLAMIDEMTMDEVILNLFRRIRPRIGWRRFALALAAVQCAAYAAATSSLRLPSGSFGWAALLGLLVGLALGQAAQNREPRIKNRSSHVCVICVICGWFWQILLLLALLAIGAALVVAAAGALPPQGLVAQDLAAWLSWLAAWLRRAASWGAQPAARSWPFLAATLPRLARELLAAADAGERGARLIVLAGGMATTWAGALALGWGLARRRNLFAWALPALAAVAFITTVGGSSGAELVFALALLLLLTIDTAAQQRQRGWDRLGADYSDELSTDALAWGAGAVALVLLLALILPTSLSNPLTRLIWRDVELPSGIAVLERNIPRQLGPLPRADIGISVLPAVALGQSLAGTPPDELVLRVRVAPQLPPGPWPHYWRARVLSVYSGRAWAANARVSPFPPGPVDPARLAGGVLQEFDDLRTDRRILPALADVVAIEQGAQAERLADGSLAALTADGQATRYRVLSRPQELAAEPRPDARPPDLQPYLALPESYPQRVRDLAAVVVGARSSAYEQALAIEAYLRGLPYAYEVQPIPADGDAVEQFLFDMRQGYCTYYASAMAVMARTLDIPARVAIGYATGEYDSASGAYLVRQADAHAWPELYIGGRWLPFEPTPIRPLPARNSQPIAPTATPALAPAPAARSYGPLIWAAALAAVAALSLLGWRWGRAHRPLPPVAQVQAHIEQAGARAGVAWPPGATLHEYGALLAARIGASPDLSQLIELIERARYSPHPLRAEHTGQLRALARRVIERLRRVRR